MNNAENIKNLIELSAQHPDLPILAMVDGEIVCDDSYGRWLGSIGSVEIGEYVCYDDHFIDDREEFMECFYDYNDEELCEKFDYNPRINEFALKNGSCTQEQFDRNKLKEKKLDAYLEEVADRAFRSAIFVNIDVPDECDWNDFEEGVD